MRPYLSVTMMLRNLVGKQFACSLPTVDSAVLQVSDEKWKVDLLFVNADSRR